VKAQLDAAQANVSTLEKAVQEAVQQQNTAQNATVQAWEKLDRMRTALAEARFQVLQQQIEQQKEISVAFEHACGEEMAKKQCREQAMERAKRDAIEKGAAILVDAVSEAKLEKDTTGVPRLRLTKDEIKTESTGLMQNLQTVRSEFTPNGNFSLEIKAIVKGQAGETLKERVFNQTAAIPALPEVVKTGLATVPQSSPSFSSNPPPGKSSRQPTQAEALAESEKQSKLMEKFQVMLEEGVSAENPTLKAAAEKLTKIIDDPTPPSTDKLNTAFGEFKTAKGTLTSVDAATIDEVGNLLRDILKKTEAKAGLAMMPQSLPSFSSTNPQPNKNFRDKLKDGSLEPEMVRIPGGTFQMGSNGGSSVEKPVHMVTVKSFALGKHEVTFEEYDKFCDATGRSKPSDEGWGRGKRPVINVDWDDAKAYVKWLSEQTGKDYRLPTEAQWEYACRAGSTGKFSFGDDVNELGNYGWYGNNSGSKTHIVGEKQPNKFGLYDMHGNVWEWLEDKWHTDYSGAPSDGSAWMTESSSSHLLRGGSWRNDDYYLRCAHRIGGDTTTWVSYRGFRIAKM